MRGIVNHEATHESGALPKAEHRQQLRRLLGLGILARQPAIAAHGKVTEGEGNTITNSIL